MQELIYYPNFEIYDEEWLKFSLLYFHTLRPIIPYKNESDLSDQFQLIKQETNLIKPFRPDGYLDNMPASKDAAEIVQEIINDPYPYSEAFNTINVIREWKNPENWKVDLYYGKYTEIWKEIVDGNDMGLIEDNYMRISEGLCNLYMTIYAHILSEAHGIPIITDKQEIHRYSVFARNKYAIGIQRKNLPKMVFSHKVIKTLVPQGLGKIPLSEIIALRKDDELQKKLTAFHLTIDEVLSPNHKKLKPEEIIQKHESVLGEYADFLIRAGFKVSKFAMSILNPEKTIDLAEEAFEGAKTGYESYSILNGGWNKAKIKRHTRKYLADIKKLKKAAHNKR